MAEKMKKIEKYIDNEPVVIEFEGPHIFNGKVKVIIKSGVIEILRRIEANVRKNIGDDEFAVLFKGHWDSKKKAYVVEPDYYIPRQKVSHSFVEFEEAEAIADGYNVAVHKHPRGLRSFSGHDYDNICAVFPISLLYVDGEIVTGTVKATLQDTDAIVLVPVEVEVEYPPVPGVEKIQRREVGRYAGYLGYGYSLYGEYGKHAVEEKGSKGKKLEGVDLYELATEIESIIHAHHYEDTDEYDEYLIKVDIENLLSDYGIETIEEFEKLAKEIDVEADNYIDEDEKAYILAVIEEAKRILGS